MSILTEQGLNCCILKSILTHYVHQHPETEQQRKLLDTAMDVALKFVDEGSYRCGPFANLLWEAYIGLHSDEGIRHKTCEGIKQYAGIAKALVELGDIIKKGGMSLPEVTQQVKTWPFHENTVKAIVGSLETIHNNRFVTPQPAYPPSRYTLSEVMKGLQKMGVN